MGQKILLADDSNVAQRMGKEILSGEGFEVTAVSNGQAALKKLKEYTPDLILADIFMPGASGYELCQFVKSEPLLARIPVLLLVGAMEPYDPEEGRRVRADGVITKPLQSSNLLSLVKQVLEAPPRPERPRPASTRAPAKVISIPVNKPAAVEPAPFAEATAAMVAPVPPTPPPKSVTIPVTEPAAAESAPFAESTAAMWAPAPPLAPSEEAAVPAAEPAAVEPAFFPETAEAAVPYAPESLPESAPATPQEMAEQTQALLEDLLGTGAPEPEPALATPQEITEQTHALLEDLLGTGAPEPEPLSAMPQEAAEQPQALLEELQDTGTPEIAWNEPEPEHYRVDFADAGGAEAPAIAEPEPEATGAAFPFPMPPAAEETSETATVALFPSQPSETEEPAADDRRIAFAEASSEVLVEGEEASSSFEFMSRSTEVPVSDEADEEVLSLLGEVTLAELEAAGLQELMNAEPPAEPAEAPAQLVWTAERVEVTEQDQQVFAETTADWEALAQLAEDSAPIGVSAPAASAEKSEPVPAPAAQSPEPAIGTVPIATAEPEAAGTQVQEPETAPAPAPPEAPFAAVTQADAPAPLVVDPGMLERLVRESVEKMMPQIVDRIVRSVGIVLRREQE